MGTVRCGLALPARVRAAYLAARGCPRCGCALLYNGRGFSCISCAFTAPLAAGSESGPGKGRKLLDRRPSPGLPESELDCSRPSPS